MKISIDNIKAVEQRIGEELAEGDSLKAAKDLCYILLPKMYANKNIICILIEDIKG